MTEIDEFNHLDVPMVEWPRVEATAGIDAALSSLHAHHRFFIATNAGQSNAIQVNQALQRVGLDSYFEKIFTYNETHARKPDTAFFRAIERMTGEFRTGMVMVGDAYAADITGAKSAGWKAAWYNPQNIACPGAMPFHDIEIDWMAELPAMLGQPWLPEIPTCLLWLQQHNASSHLLIHVQLVASVAYLLALQLRSAGIGVNPILAHRGGLLHDLAKGSHMENMDHGQAAAEILRKRGEPALAAIADHHMLFTLLDENRQPRSWEEKLVYYADKLVEKGQLVSVEERLAGLQERYAIDNSLLTRRLIPGIKDLEQEICSTIGADPEELIASLQTRLAR